MLHTDEIVDIRIGGQSLVGVGRERPSSWGNYFSFWDGTRVLNMWVENLEAADKEFNLGGKVKIRRYGKVCLIDDDRIPKNWYHNKLCFTGGGSPSYEVAKDMYEYLGDPNNELEQFSDPESYWEKRGATYHNGMVITGVKATSRKLNVKWTTEQSVSIVIPNNGELPCG